MKKLNISKENCHVYHWQHLKNFDTQQYLSIMQENTSLFYSEEWVVKNSLILYKELNWFVHLNQLYTQYKDITFRLIQYDIRINDKVIQNTTLLPTSFFHQRLKTIPIVHEKGLLSISSNGVGFFGLYIPALNELGLYTKDYQKTAAPQMACKI